MDVSIIIPNFNGEKLLKENLPKVISNFDSSSYRVKEVIIVDDCSDDQSVGIIKSFIDKYNERAKILLIENDKNLGFSSSVNKGVASSSGEYIVLFNTDVVPEEEFLSKVLKHFNDKNVFAVGCLDKSVENGKIVLRGRGLGTWRRGFLIHYRGEVDKTDTLWVSGGSGIFRKSIWEKLGGFDKLYNPFYWEDIDLSYRALKSGYKILFDPACVVFHKHEEGSIISKFSSFRIHTISYRNQFFFSWLNMTDNNLLFTHFFWLPLYFIKSFLMFDFAFYLGFSLAFFKIFSVLNQRNKNIKTFVKTDRAVISYLSL